jgi:4-alpha-glucanotransferase
VDQVGVRQSTADATRAAILAALGFDAQDEAAARRTLAALAARDAERLVAPTRVAILPPERAGAPARTAQREAAAALALPARGSGEWRLTVTTEDGAVHERAGRVRAGRDGSASIALPVHPGLGYHRLRLTMRARGGERTAEQTLIVAPASCPDPAALLGGRRAFGLTANLYSVRSARNWGAGDTTDLRALVGYAGGVGAAFVGVNPLHALRNDGDEISPYSPVSRLFRNVLYLDVDAVPELAESREARRLVEARGFRAELARLRAADRVDYAAVMRLKLPVLERLHETFRGRRGGARRAAYARYQRAQGEPLASFATFLAIDETMRARGVRNWREWPAELRAPDAAGVGAFRRSHAARVDFHQWLQFELDEQLAAAAADGRALGLPIGLYQDLAIGTSGSSSDAWAFPDLFVPGTSVGAPPDPLAPQGQNWGLPPIHPLRLAEQGFAYWTALLRGALRHAGALRIDHILGLFRQFWIPEGMPGSEGAYVRVPTRELLGVLALESTRAGAIVVGEDLGTVPPEVPPTLEQWGVLSSRVFYFERGDGGAFKAARAYPRMALATANTHDLPTLAGFWEGRDVALRRELGLLASERAGRAALADRAVDRDMLVRRLVEEGIVADDGAPLDDLALRAAVHAFLRRTPSWLVGLSLDDLAGERDPVNLPGVGPADYPSWTRRLAMPLETLVTSPAARRALGAEREWVDEAR